MFDEFDDDGTPAPSSTANGGGGGGVGPTAAAAARREQEARVRQLDARRAEEQRAEEARLAASGGIRHALWGAARLVGGAVAAVGRAGLGYVVGSASIESSELHRQRVARALVLREQVNRSLARRLRDHVAALPKRVFVGTWNVAQAAPPPMADMLLWLRGNAAEPVAPAGLPRLAVIGLQEAAMSGAAMVLETTEAIAEWSEAFHTALHQLAKDAGQPTRYRKLHAVQLVGLIMIVFAPHEEFANVRHLRAAVTRTGPLSTVGNKGAVGCRLTFHGKRILFICGHFAPHEHNVGQRDHHYHSALDRLDLAVPDSCDDVTDFVLRLQPDNSAAGQHSEAAAVRGAGWAERLFHRREFRQLKNATERSRALLHSHDYTFFFGDLNYRLVRSADAALIRSLMSARKISQLLQYDELTLGVRKRYIFEDFVEAPVRFLPTYKLVPNAEAYDMTKRKPAWTDRVLVHCLHGTADVESAMRRGADDDDNGSCASPTDEGVAFVDVDDSRSGGMKRSFSNDSFENASFGSAGSNNSTAPPAHSPHLGPTDAAAGTALPGSSPLPPTTPSFDDFIDRLDHGAGLSDIVENRMAAVWYCSVPSLRMSDHRPVCAAFDVSCAFLSQRAKEELIFDTKQELGLDFLDELKLSY